MKLIFNVKNKLENCTINVILEQIYLILFSILLIYQFFFTTMFSIEWPVIIQTYLRTIIILLLVLKTAVDEKPSISEFIIMFALGLIFLLSWKNNGGDEIFLCLLSIWGARNIDFKKILKVFFGVILFLLIFTMISALTGNVENLVFYQEGRRPRMAFGICYPTDFAAYVFYLAVIYCYFRKEKLKYIETGIKEFNYESKRKYEITARKHQGAKRGVNLFQSVKKGKIETSIMRCNREQYKYQHPTQKPVALMERIVKLVSDENDTVLDPFMGGGSTGVACINTNRKFIGIELDDEYFDTAVKRVSKAYQDKQENIINEKAA